MSTSPITLHVESDHAGERLDIYLTAHLADAPSRTFVRHLIDEGRVRLNDVVRKPHHSVAAGDVITVDLPESSVEESRIEPENIPLNIFYEDKFLIVINKPAGMLVHPVPGQSSGTLVNALRYHCATLSDANDPLLRPGIVHRLDRETSGLIVAAKDNVTHVRLARAFEKRRVFKQYVALAQGHLEFDEGVIEAPLGRHPRFWDKKTISFLDDAKAAMTVYKVLQRFPASGPYPHGVTLVALLPKSGRTHQLRVHLAHLHCPILGDAKYGRADTFPRLALHARCLGFQHPQTKAYVEFVQPTPGEFFINRLKGSED